MLITVLVIFAIVAVAGYLAWRSSYEPQKSVSKTFDNAVLEIKVPKNNTEKLSVLDLHKAPIASEQMFSSLHGLLQLSSEIQEHLSFEIVVRSGEIVFYAVVPRHLQSFVEGQIYAQYPDSQIKEVKDYMTEVAIGGENAVTGAYLSLSKPTFFPIKSFLDFEVDPLSAITGALSGINDASLAGIQILLRPVPDKWQKAGYSYVEKIRMGLKPVTISMSEIGKTFTTELLSIFLDIPKKLFTTAAYVPPARTADKSQPVRLSAGQDLELKAVENKLTKMGFEVGIRLIVKSYTKALTTEYLRALEASFTQFSTSHLNSFAAATAAVPEAFTDDYIKRRFPDASSYILNTEELASIFHLPSATVETPTISWAFARRSEPPLNLPTKDCTYFGVTTFRDKALKFGIRDIDRTVHMYAIGKTGTGKSTIFKNMIVQDIERGAGVGVIDPHGQLIEELLEFVPEHRLKDVVLFDPSDTARPPALNILECPDQAQKNLMASGLVEVFKKNFENSWGPRLEYLLNNCFLTLLEVPGTTLLGVLRLLNDDNYRKFILYQVKDPVIKRFWEVEFMEMKGNQKLITEAVSPIQNKVGRFLSSSTMRNILGQKTSSIKLDEIMDTGKIFFVSLAKGKIGEDNSNLLGSMIISRLQFMAMQRVTRPESQRPYFFLFVDEFQNFATGAFANILSEARKMHLCLHLTHQYVTQLPEELQQAVFGNVGTFVALTLGAVDAKYLAPEFAPVFNETDLITLEPHHMYVKMMVNGMTCMPFSAASLKPPVPPEKNFKEEARRLSSQTYGTDSAFVEEKVKLWMNRQFNMGMAIADEKRHGVVPPSTPLINVDPLLPTSVQSKDVIDDEE
ncbi:MAG: type IV secretion system DNA-binding domain-containing protein [candidate division WWE3 bacterium]|nr:type IV secretion system DNA-binding domain-containing protein [candidate division WWE3 bacterium]